MAEEEEEEEEKMARQRKKMEKEKKHMEKEMAAEQKKLDTMMLGGLGRQVPAEEKSYAQSMQADDDLEPPPMQVY